MVPECGPFLLRDQLLRFVVLLEHGVFPNELVVNGSGVTLLAGARGALVLPGVSLSHDDDVDEV